MAVISHTRQSRGLGLGPVERIKERKKEHPNHRHRVCHHVTCTHTPTTHSILFYNVPTLSDISSTAVRKSTDVRLLREALEPPVLDYICEHRLYAIGRYANGRRLGGGGAGSSGGGKASLGPRRRVRWLVLTGLFVTVSVLLAWRKWGLAGMGKGLHAALRAVKGLVRIEKAA
jgi:hypothetical protein